MTIGSIDVWVLPVLSAGQSLQKGQLGLAVMMVDLGTNAGEIFRDIRKGGFSGYSIRVNIKDVWVRQRFTVAHELGHFLRHRNRVQNRLIDDRMYRSGHGKTVEYEANSLAAELLMPRRARSSIRGMQQSAADTLVNQRGRAPFFSIEDLADRVPLSRDNLAMLARIGALNNLRTDAKLNRRDTLWQVERAVRKAGPLLEGIAELNSVSPLRQMDVEERLVADYHGTGLTTGHHPMAYRRDILRKRGVKSASELKNIPHGKEATVAGCVITRQRPGTAKGIIFMTLEDETGTSRVIISPDFYDNRFGNTVTANSADKVNTFCK